MSHSHPTSSTAQPADIAAAIEAAIPDSKAEVSGGDGHYVIHVVSSAFASKRLLAKHRMVLSAVNPFMEANGGPVHAVDRIVCELPE